MACFDQQLGAFQALIDMKPVQCELFISDGKVSFLSEGVTKL
jgi:hypothetical protein